MDDQIRLCREEVDNSMLRLEKEINLRLTHLEKNAWTEERVEDVANKAADKAVEKITITFYSNVGKKTIAIVGAAVIAATIFLTDVVKNFFGIR